jgi:hypothetical protein
MWSGADSLRPDWLSMSVRSRPSSEQCPRDGVPSEEPGRQGAKREAVSAPTSRQAEWSGGAWPREQVHMGVFSVTSGAELAGVSPCQLDYRTQFRLQLKQCIYVIEALRLRYARPVSRNGCRILVLQSSVVGAHGVHWEDEHWTKIHLYAQRTFHT